MSRTLNCSPILTSRYTYTINAIHNPFIVGRGPVYIVQGKFICFQNFLSDLNPINSFPAHILDGKIKVTHSFPLSAVVAQNSDTSFNTHFGNHLFSSFTECVGDIGAHGFTNIDNDINRVLFGIRANKLAISDISHSPTSGNHTLAELIQIF